MMATLPPSDRPRVIKAASPLLAVAAFLLTGLLLGSELESNAMGFMGACMIFLVATALRGAVGGAARRRR